MPPGRRYPTARFERFPSFSTCQFQKCAIPISARPQINPQLLALLIEVTALQSQSLRGIGHVILMLLQFRQNRLALKSFRAHRQRPRSRRHRQHRRQHPSRPVPNSPRRPTTPTLPSPHQSHRRAANNKIRSTTFRNSRTFPGQEYFSNSAIAASAKALLLPTILRRHLPRKIPRQQTDILAPLAQRRQQNRKHENAVIQILPERSRPSPAPPDRDAWPPPRARPRQSAYLRPRARSRLPPARAATFACIPSGISPISSRKKVPRCACSNFPTCRPEAPVNAPFSCPNNSDSINSAGIAAQFKVTKGPPRRALFS